MKIHFYNRQKDFPLRKQSVQKIVRLLCHFLSIECDEIGFYFVTEEEMTALHGRFFHDPTPTDCISFPIDHSYLGDVFICPKVAVSYAKKRNLDPFEEIILYLVHGLLHLLDYDDQDPKRKRLMRKKEKSCIHHLKKLGAL